MVRVEPVQLEISGQTSDLNTDNLRFRIEDWPPIGNWLLGKLFEDSDYEMIDNSRIQEVIREATTEVYNNVRDISPKMIDSIIDGTSRAASSAATGAPILISKNDVLILISDRPAHLFMISDNFNNIISIIEEWKDEMATIQRVAEDFGVDIGTVRFGEELVDKQIERISGERINEEEQSGFDDELEEFVYSSINEEITRCLDSNVELQFDEEILTDTFEYDVLCYPSPNLLIIVEAKDGSHENAELDKSDLVTRQKEKADVISDKANVARTECFVVTREINEQKFGEFSDLADRRDINLLKYSDGGFVDEISGIVHQFVSQEAMGPGGGGMYRFVRSNI